MRLAALGGLILAIWVRAGCGGASPPPTPDIPATVTRGIVRAVLYEGDTQRWVIQTDAPINPGNSVGPLFSASGQVMGISIFKVVATREGRTGEGLGFAVSEVAVREPRFGIGAAADRRLPLARANTCFPALVARRIEPRRNQ